MCECSLLQGCVLHIAICAVVLDCSLYVSDDKVFEGNESLIIWLEEVSTSETEVILSSNTSAVTVYIVDPEDCTCSQYYYAYV